MNINPKDPPSWHKYELVIYHELRRLIPKGEKAGLLMNLRLGHERASEADILYAGTLNGKSAAIIVECKNRRVEVDENGIWVPKFTTSEREDIMPSIQEKIKDARNNLGFTVVRVIVVANNENEFSRAISPEILVIGQPIFIWHKTKKHLPQTFESLINGWTLISKEIQPIDHNSHLFYLLGQLPRHTWWNAESIDDWEKDRDSAQSDRDLDYLIGEN